MIFYARCWVLKGWLTVFFSRLDCVYGVQSSMCSCLVFLKTHYFSHNLPLFHTSLSLLWQMPRFISWFYEAPPSEIRGGLRLVSWLSVLWFAKPPLLHVWTSYPSPQWHVLRLKWRGSCRTCASTALNDMFGCCCLILLNTLLFVSATASVSF